MDFIRVRGYNRVRNQLRYLVRQFPLDVDLEMAAWAGRTAETMRQVPYPPPLEKQKYVRTYKLQNSWQYRREDKMRYVIHNPTTYAGYVVARGKQSEIHEGRWWIAEEILQTQVSEDLTRRLTDLLETKLEEISGE